MTEFQKGNNVSIFAGDSLDYIISLYKDESVPEHTRLYAAALALPFERPRLVATASVTKHIDGADANFAKLFQQIEARLARAPPEARAEVIDMLREESEESE